MYFDPLNAGAFCKTLINSKYIKLHLNFKKMYGLWDTLIPFKIEVPPYNRNLLVAFKVAQINQIFY